MSRNISQNAREAVYASQTGDVFLYLLRIYSEELAQNLYFVQNNENITSNGNVHMASSFSLSLPVQEEGQVQDTVFSISGVSRQIIELIRSISESLDVEITIIRSSAPDILEAGPWDFKLRNVSYTKDTVTGNLLFETALRNNISTIRVTNQNFPGAF